MEQNINTIKPADNYGYTWPLNMERRQIEINSNFKTEESTKLEWVCQDGPFLLEDLPDVGSLEKVADAIWQEDLEAALLEAKSSWEPYIAENGEDNARRVIITGATNRINARDGVDIDYLKNHGAVLGANSILETREIALAKPGDVVFGNCKAWREIANRRNDIEAYPIGKGFLNYNSHRWLYKILESIGEEEPSDPELQAIINHLAIDPNLVLQVYATDEETDLFFLYLRDKVNEYRNKIDPNLPLIDKLKVDANSDEVTRRLSSKGYLYPSPESVYDLEVKEDTYESWIEAEGELSPIQKDLGYLTPRMPGYHIEWNEDYKKFAKNVALAIDLMKNRWGSTNNYFKHIAGADGGSAFPSNFESEDFDIGKLIDKLYSGKHSWVVEPFVNYRRFEVEINGNTQVRSLAPSIHVRGGKAYDTKLVQLLVAKKCEDGSIEETGEWGGHVYSPRSEVERVFNSGEKYFGMNEDEYNQCFQALEDLVERYKENGFSRGGIDTAIGTIDTRWGKIEINALQDMNIRTTAGDTTRAFGKLIEQEFGREFPFTTLVIKPEMGIEFEDVENALDEIAIENNLDRDLIRLVCTIPPGWGLFGTISKEAKTSLSNAFTVEKGLRKRGLIV
ncbi:hypothetical protein GF362_02610 [Candidatus Dojkabacteria bacterium]|nr:hypothetical protein [Candidatus Dojkabacteria bacterium]